MFEQEKSHEAADFKSNLFNILFASDRPHRSIVKWCNQNRDRVSQAEEIGAKIIKGTWNQEVLHKFMDDGGERQ